MTACLIVAAAILMGTRIGGYLHERRTIEHGTPVNATVTAIGLSAAAREGSRDEIQHVVLNYTPPGASESLDADGDLPRKPDAMISLKDVLRVRIDPKEPTYWTERDTPPPVTLMLVTPLMCLMVGVISFFIAWLRRGSVLRTVRQGQRVTGHVVSVKQSPLAPLSKQIGVAIAGDDRRVLTCYWPGRLGPVAAGQAVDVIADPPRAVVASLYEPASSP